MYGKQIWRDLQGDCWLLLRHQDEVIQIQIGIWVSLCYSTRLWLVCGDKEALETTGVWGPIGYPQGQH